MYQKVLLLALSVIFYFTSLFLSSNNIFVNYKFFTLYLSILPVLVIFTIWIKTNNFNFRKFINNNYKFIFLIVIISLLTRFIHLYNYPFVSVGDEVRDSGLNVQEILNGKISNIFGYGRYNAHGLIIPSLLLPFLSMFNSSVYLYRVPAAIISIFDIIIVYLLSYKLLKNNLFALITSLTLISLPLHLYYSRTELVVILSSFFSNLILFILYLFYFKKRKSIFDYAFLGTIFGFSFNFHASLKTIVVLNIIFVLYNIFYTFLKEKINFKQSFINFLIFIIFIFVGFGPRLIQTENIALFLHSSRIPILNNFGSTVSFSNFYYIVIDYLKSVLVWGLTPTYSWFPDHKPILDIFSFILFIFGFIYTFKIKNKFFIWLLIITFVVHFTNSAITDILNADHRLSPLFGVGSIFVGYGFYFIYQKFYNNLLKIIFLIFVITLFIVKTLNFFLLQKANINKDQGDYLSMHIIYFLKNNYQFKNTSNIFLTVSPSNFNKFELLHFKEQREYFLPGKNIIINFNSNLQNNQAVLENEYKKEIINTFTIFCHDNYYLCPLEKMDYFSIYY